MSGVRTARRKAPASRRAGDDASGPKEKPAGDEIASHIENWQDLRALLNASLTEQDWRAIVRRLAKAAAAGESNAIKLLIELAVGKTPGDDKREAAKPIEIIEVECGDE